MRRPEIIRRLIALRHGGAMVRRIYDTCLRIAEPFVFALRNRPARAAFRAATPQLSDAGRRVLEQLSSSGYAFAHYSELVPPEAWAELEREVQTWLASPEHRAGGPAGRPEMMNFKKPFQIFRSDTRAHLQDFHDPVVRFGARKELLDIVNSYLQMMSRMLGADVWHTLTVEESYQRRMSQNWHRDPEDTRLVKVFAYFTDVDEGTGAMEYVPHSRLGEKYGNVCPPKRPRGAYVPGGTLADLVPADDRVSCSFPAGTILFVDTVGLHRGGFATKGDRVLATWIYSSQATHYAGWFQIRNAPAPETVPIEERFALLTK